MINSRSRVFFAWPEAVRSCFDPNRRSYVTDAKLQPVSDSEPTLRTMFTRNVRQLRSCLSFLLFFLSLFFRQPKVFWSVLDYLTRNLCLVRWNHLACLTLYIKRRINSSLSDLVLLEDCSGGLLWPSWLRFGLFTRFEITVAIEL